MEQVWRYYNTLPTLLEAKDRFNNREQVFDSLAGLLSKYNNMYGVCLVHAHCTLSAGEIMLEENDVCQPVWASDATACQPERWLPSGEPYEFTTRSTQAPPDELVDEFRGLTDEIGVLGLYYAGVEQTEEIKLEWTEGRKNVVRTIKDEDWELEPVETAWKLGKGDRVMVLCILLCARATTESGGYHLSECLISKSSNTAGNLFAEKKVHKHAN